MLTDTAATSKQKNLAMLRATRNFLDGMEKAGIGSAAAMRTLTEEQKDALAEDGYIQAAKKKYNKWTHCSSPQQHKIKTTAIKRAVFKQENCILLSQS